MTCSTWKNEVYSLEIMLSFCSYHICCPWTGYKCFQIAVFNSMFIEGMKYRVPIKADLKIIFENEMFEMIFKEHASPSRIHGKYCNAADEERCQKYDTVVA